MVFIKIINNKKFTLLSIFLFIYLTFNLLDGQRGLISYFEKKDKINELINENKVLTDNLNLIEKQNNLLTNDIDLDYLETLYRKKFMFGKKNEKVFIKQN